MSTLLTFLFSFLGTLSLPPGPGARALAGGEQSVWCKIFVFVFVFVASWGATSHSGFEASDDTCTQTQGVPGKTPWATWADPKSHEPWSKTCSQAAFWRSGYWCMERWSMLESCSILSYSKWTKKASGIPQSLLLSATSVLKRSSEIISMIWMYDQVTNLITLCVTKNG